MDPQPLDRELQFHLDQLTAKYLAQGMTESEAHRRARLEFGGTQQLKEECRDTRPTLWLDSTLQDIRFALRSMRKNPALTATIVVTLALGIGVNTAIFSVVDAVLLRPLPYPDPDRLVTLYETTERFPRMSSSYPNYLDFRRMNRSCQDLAALLWSEFNLTGVGQPERLHGRMISSSAFQVLGMRPLLGRSFTEKEDHPGGTPVVAISESLWRRRFGADPTILGRSLTLNGRPYTVVAVLPAEFQFPFLLNWHTEDVALPLGQSVDELMMNRGFHSGSRIVGRLQPRVATSAAQADFTRIASALGREYPKENAGHGVWVESLRDIVVGEYSGTLYLLMGVVAFVLLIACANVANLLLARATAREQEIAMRTALGAGRARILRQMLTESTLVALAGGLAGLLLAWASTSALAKSASRILPRAGEIAMDSRVLLFTLAAAVFTGILFGLVPALRFARSQFRASGRSIVAGRHPFRDLLVVTQIALTLPLLVGGALMVRSLWNLRSVHPGFDPRNVLALDVSFSPSSASSGASIRRAQTDLLRRLEAMPGVEAAAAIGNLPMSGNDMAAPLWVAGRPMPKDPSQVPVALMYPTSPDYLRVMRVPLLRGRFFDARDIGSRQPVVVIDENTARALFPNEDPIGQSVVTGSGVPSLVIGLVGHVKHSGLDDELKAGFIQLQAYYPALQLPDQFLKMITNGSQTYLVRAQRDLPGVEAELRRAIHSVDPDDAVSDVRLMDQVVTGTLSYRKFLLSLLAVFAGIALVLAVVGIYGVISYSVSRRTREIGIRMALGAARGNILTSIVGQGASLASAGIVLGIAASFFLTRFLASFLFGIGRTDPLTFCGVALVLGLVSLAASFLPALRGSRADPLAALRCE